MRGPLGSRIVLDYVPDSLAYRIGPVGRDMSTQSFPLQPLGQNADPDEDADPGCLEPPEDGTNPGTKGSRKVQCWKNWPRKNILITVTSLLGYLSLYTGVSMIAPFYPIVVSSTHFS